MATKNIINYDEKGMINIETIEVPNIDIDVKSQIKQKEDELIRIYNEIQELKSK